MKKKSLKRIFASVLSGVMIMSAVPTIFADTPTTSTILDSKTVSLTIHKYEYDGDAGSIGTGSESDSVPNDATALKDVTFTVYKVADIVQVQDGGVTSIKYETLSELLSKGVSNYIDAGMQAEQIKSTFTDNDEVMNVLNSASYTYKAEKTTGADGIAKFTSSDLAGIGLYLVVETDYPSKVTEPSAPFLVSLPTTLNIKNDAGEVASSGWLYDVHAYPKNSTMTSAITIKKDGKVPNSSTTTPLNGAKFKLEMENGEDNWVVQKKDANGGTIGDADGIVTISDGSLGVTITNLAPGNYRFVETEAPTGYIADTLAYHEFSIDTDGFVYVNGSKTSTITITNEQPTIKKEVLKNGGNVDVTSDWSHDADYSTGDAVPYKITVTVPETIAKLNTFKVTDTYSDTEFELIEDSFEIKCYSGEGNTLTEVPNVFTLNDDMLKKNVSTGIDDMSWIMDLSKVKTELSNENITTIEIFFKLTLTKDAETAGNGNPNKGILEYTNKTKLEGDYSEEETTSIDDKAIVYTFGLKINKTFVGSDSNELSAQFDLYREDESGTNVSGINKKVVKVNNNPIEVVNGETVVLDTSNSDDNCRFGLENGTYYLVEVKTAGGYNLLKEPIKIKIQKYYETKYQKTTTTKKITYDLSGNITGTSTLTETTDGIDEITYYSDEAKTNPITETTIEVKVENKKGFEFPKTGGKGTVIFTVSGLVLMILAVIIFFKSKKKSRA